MAKAIIKPENLLKGYKGLAEKFGITPRTARRIVKEKGIIIYHANEKAIYFDYQDAYTKYILRK